MFGLIKDTHNVVVVGCGVLGAILAEKLYEEENGVTVIDKDSAAFDKLPVYFGGDFLNRDANDAEVLIEAGVEKADTVIAVTGDDVLNLFISKIAKDVFHVEHVLSGLRDPKRKMVYKELGIQSICIFDLWMDILEKEKII
ncbi:NAD-binding protein [Aminipila terrae]|uniref:TrkA family potassium uptake protein n=1 Tax=Aminipila terrae TaxID=2697030 RepID=A0A6P1MIA2_9FIRM|nr:NAD-binding protein [Aminipila terrae]QHI72334.1 TrkA family potassium uptake protein [Aminipila terrae]